VRLDSERKSELTDLGAARARLEEAEERLRLALDAGGVGSWDYDPRTGTFRCDARFKALFGMSPDAAPTARQVGEAIHPDDREAGLSAVAHSMAPESGGEYAREYRAIGVSDRVVRWVSARGRTLFDERGAPVRFIGTVIDITQQRNALERAAFLEHAGALLGSSLDYKFTLAQITRLAVPRFADYCSAELVNERAEVDLIALTHVDPALAERFRSLRDEYGPTRQGKSLIRRVLQTGKPLLLPEVSDALLVARAESEEHLRHLRSLGLTSAMVVPLLGRDRVVGVVTLLYTQSLRRYDEDDLQLMEEIARRAAIAIDNAMLYRAAQNAIERRDDFLSVASHELKTPVSTLLLQFEGLLSDLDRGDVPPNDIHAHLVKSLAQVHRLVGLVDDLLDVSRAASGHLRISKTTMDLSDLACEVIARFRESAARAGCRIDIRAEGRTVGRWDEARLDQVLTNLLSNAIKFAPNQPIEVRVERIDSRIRLGVVDRGPGIAPEDQGRIFDRFERAGATDGVGGIGLGLWIARQIVRAHGGEITVESEPGKGAAFWLDLPV
jgi:signal transduction histidine kinase